MAPYRNPVVAFTDKFGRVEEEYVNGKDVKGVMMALSAFSTLEREAQRGM
jgi:hypothetical protein